MLIAGFMVPTSLHNMFIGATKLEKDPEGSIHKRSKADERMLNDLSAAFSHVEETISWTVDQSNLQVLVATVASVNTLATSTADLFC